MSDIVNAGKPRVFLSYSRRDSDFVDELVISVESYGFEVVFDRADLFPGEPWEPRLQRLITDAETTVCVVSKSWVASEQCTKELSIAVRNGRRIVPVIIDPVNPSEMPDELARLQFIHFHGPGQSYARGVVSLVQTLRTDISWLRDQTRLLDKADEWTSQERPDSLLLRGVALEKAQAWLAAPAPRDTHVLPAVTAFIEASRAGQDTEEKQRLRDRLRFTIVGLAACVFGLVGTGAVGFIVYDQLQRTQAEKAVAEEGLAVAEINLDETTQLYENSQIEAGPIPAPSPAGPLPQQPERGEMPEEFDPGLEDAPVTPPDPASPPQASDTDTAKLVAALDSPDKSVRLAAGQTVTNRVREPGSDALLTALVAELELARFGALSPAGRVNVLYMLNAYGGWSRSELGPQVTRSLAAIEAASRQKGSGIVLGGQASGCVATLKQRIAGEPATGCGA
jgi:hypothetical protein